MKFNERNDKRACNHFQNNFKFTFLFRFYSLANLRRPYPGAMQLELKIYFQLLVLNKKFKDRRFLPAPDLRIGSINENLLCINYRIR